MISKGDVAQQTPPAGRPCWGCQAPRATSGGAAVSQGTLLSMLGDQFCCMRRREGKGQGRIRPVAPISLTLTAPYRNVLEAGAPQPGGGNAKRDTETSGSPGKGPSSPTIHTMISITGPQSLPWLPFPLISTTPRGGSNLNPALFLSKSKLLSSSLQNIKESSRAQTKGAHLAPSPLRFLRLLPTPHTKATTSRAVKNDSPQATEELQSTGGHSPQSVWGLSLDPSNPRPCSVSSAAPPQSSHPIHDSLAPFS